MQRWKFSREFELARLIKERGVSVAQASRDLNLHVNVLRKRITLQLERESLRVRRPNSSPT
jgi:transposase